MVGQPDPGFFDAVAVGNAVNGEGGFAHRVESCRKRSVRRQWATIRP
jgi:hypothetical protein